MIRSSTSPSNLHRRVRCPGSHAAELGLPEQNSEYAEEGTRLHAGLDPQFFATTDYADKELELIASTKEIFAEVIERTVAAMAIPPDAPFTEGYERELRVRSKLRTVMVGHCDHWRYYPDQKVLVITDAKFGFIEVTPAPLNLQLRAYAVMGSQEWDVEHAVVAIAQPRAGMIDDAEKLTIAQYDRADLDLAHAQILEWECEWLKPFAPRVPSEDACRYCKAKLLCNQYAERMGSLKGDVVAGIADLPEDRFAMLFEALKIAAKADTQKAILAEARVRVAEGRLPGYRLKPNAARRSITDNAKASAILRDGLAFTQDEIAEASSLSLGEAMTVLRRKVKFKNEAEATKCLRDALATVIELKTPEPSVVPVSSHDVARTV